MCIFYFSVRWTMYFNHLAMHSLLGRQFRDTQVVMKRAGATLALESLQSSRLPEETMRAI